jgi:putative membrane protein
MNTTQFLLSSWSWNPMLMLLCVVAGLAYVAAFGVPARVWYFAVALVVMLLALISPINALADGYLFSAHMVQHILLLLVVPALLLLSLPRSFARPEKARILAIPVVGWLAGVGAMWVWHVPVLCNAAVTSQPIFLTQTGSLLVLGGLFWWQVLAPREEQRLTPLAAVGYLFTACLACSALGIILTFSPVTVCGVYMHPADRLGMLGTIRSSWGMTPEKDQQIGGLLMWVPMCLIYLTAIMGQLARWFAHPTLQSAFQENR